MEKTRPEVITSIRNPLLKDVRKAIVRGGLTEEGCAVADSFHLLEEAIRSDCAVDYVLVSHSVRAAVDSHIRGLKSIRLVVLPDGLFARLAPTESSQGVIALVRPPQWNLEQLFRGHALVVVLDGLQDPGNAGTIVRAAEAFGATGVLFLKGAVSPHNPKTLRASAGSLFRLPYASGVDPDLAMAALEQQKLDLWAAVPRAGKSLAEADFTRRCAVIIGSEGRGVRDRLRARATELRVVTSGVESLNASIAAGVILYEARRQRSRA